MVTLDSHPTADSYTIILGPTDLGPWSDLGVRLKGAVFSYSHYTVTAHYNM